MRRIHNKTIISLPISDEMFREIMYRANLKGLTMKQYMVNLIEDKLHEEPRPVSKFTKTLRRL